MNSRKKNIFLVLLGLIAVAAGIIIYLFNMPHRDVKATKEDYVLEASAIVAEYLKDPEKANQKYLAEDGDSKIIVVSGVVSAISEDAQNNKVVLLKKDNEKTGVSCTMLSEEKDKVAQLKKGNIVKIKGVIQSGASFDEDLGMYEPAILNKCSIFQQ
ncbi:MAG: hypothetical protein OHK0045_04060 [Raineya sp.]